METSSTMPNEQDNNNPYLRMRAEKILRNNNRLLSLGLLPKVASASSSTRSNNKKRQPPSPQLPSVPVRRSARRAGIEIDYKEWSGKTAHSPPTQPPKRAKKISSTVTDPAAAVEVEIDEGALLAAKQSAASTATKLSTKNNTAHVGATVRHWLGKELESTGKAAVIDAALEASVSASVEDGEGMPHPGSISFNKYSGICVWQNDCIFLWVNINAPGADVVNEFLDGGSKMTWFGGSRMHDGTTAIQNLIRVGRKARDGTLAESDGIVLWVRMHSSKKTFRPYVCLGRVAYESHAPGTRPVEFVLKLLDCNELKKKDGKTKGQESLFQKIIEA